MTNYHDESSIKQAKNIKGLLRDDEYYQAFVNAKNNEQRLAVFNIIGVINGRGDKFDNFTRMVLKSPKDLPLWAETLSATLYKPRLSLTQAKRIPNFASEANMRDFFNSNEYRYVLQYLKPEKITHSASGRRAALNVNYGHGVNITLQRPANCQQTATYHSHDVAKTGGIFRLLGLSSEYNVTNRVTEYTCKASEQDIAQLQSWERQLTSNTLASSQIPRSWKTTNSQEIAREKIQYAPVSSNYDSGYSSNPASVASSGSSQQLWQCTVFCGKYDVKTQVLASNQSEANNAAIKYGKEYCFKLTNQLLESRWWHGPTKCQKI